MYQMIFYSPLHFHVYLITHVNGTLGAYIHLQELGAKWILDLKLHSFFWKYF